MRTASLLLAALLTSGCGGGESDPASRGARRTLEAYLQALKEGDCEAAYRTLSWNLRRRITLDQLRKNYAEHRDYYRHMAEGKVEKLFPDDFRVIAKLLSGEGRVEFVSMLPEDGEWRIEETGRTISDLYERVLNPKPGPSRTETGP